ncbi:alkylation response protein AidB-like acyl-CoA dehydrogenase [Catenuloplanes nepalensis]|uniref:Alkylation response protein AidB-like acyl-CoA dehydrogenase n=1 Tax=Catenuloplanes nepalensis TaxID=587533 RepID=A0ABT9MJU7_9ACTN|nr:acyl-CoA dehydrogenase family protein [Catenuloplanes nepalensis]MDP9791694.1 alkylation response protein AidB-like acyl-CoA dehydrogenase [Catenuloplanes nepalensis]
MTEDLVAARAADGEARDRLTPEAIGALRANGDFALAVPAAFGGQDASAETVLRRLIGIGRADPSAAWVTGVSVTSKTLAKRMSGEDVRKELFADPDAVFCGSGRLECGTGTREADGTVTITGAWPNVSGCEDAAWTGVALTIDGVPHFAHIRLGDLRIDRTWRVAGMRATGSHTVVADAVGIPDGQVIPFRPFEVNDLLLFGLCVLGPVIGGARGALDTVRNMFASGRKPFMTAYASMGESPGARHWLAEATHLIERAERTALAVAAASDGPEVPRSDLARLHMDEAAAARDCRAAVDLLLDLHGASGFGTANPLQRFWRDVAVGSRHPHLNPYLAVENLGKALV